MRFSSFYVYLFYLPKSSFHSCFSAFNPFGIAGILSLGKSKKRQKPIIKNTKIRQRIFMLPSQLCNTHVYKWSSTYTPSSSKFQYVCVYFIHEFFANVIKPFASCVSETKGTKQSRSVASCQSREALRMMRWAGARCSSKNPRNFSISRLEMWFCSVTTHFVFSVLFSLCFLVLNDYFAKWWCVMMCEIASMCCCFWWTAK